MKSRQHMRAFAAIVAIVLAAGCGTTRSDEEQDALSSLKTMYAGWRPVATRDLQRADLSTFQSAHPKGNPGMATGDFFGDGRPAYAFLITRRDSMGTWARIVVLAGTEGGRYEGFELFTESPVTRMPALHVSRPNEYQVFVGEQAMTVPTEGIIYEKFDGQRKLFFWNVDRFQDIELTEGAGG